MCRRRRVRVTELIVAICALVLMSADLAGAQGVEPLKVLEEARRDRLKLDERLAREAANAKETKAQQQRAAAPGSLGDEARPSTSSPVNDVAASNDSPSPVVHGSDKAESAKPSTPDVV